MFIAVTTKLLNKFIFITYLQIKMYTVYFEIVNEIIPKV